MKTKINCSHDEMRDLVNLVPHPKNPNTHSEEQIRLLSKIIKHQGWRNPIVVSKRSGYIVAGHGRLMAAELLGLKEAPVDLQDFDNEADELAHLVADNRIAELAEVNRSTLADLIAELDTGDFDLDLTGFEDVSLEELMTAAPPDRSDSEYTKKIKAPTYEIKGDKPEISELVDKTKTELLKQSISSHENIPGDIKEFLYAAADRHNVFNYEKIAEYYAHANQDLQELMEESALVIIDFGKAIENGYVKMSDEVAALYENEYPDE